MENHHLSVASLHKTLICQLMDVLDSCCLHVRAFAGDLSTGSWNQKQHIKLRLGCGFLFCDASSQTQDSYLLSIYMRTIVKGQGLLFAFSIIFMGVRYLTMVLLVKLG